jgi:hypothetical protein
MECACLCDQVMRMECACLCNQVMRIECAARSANETVYIITRTIITRTAIITISQ